MRTALVIMNPAAGARLRSDIASCIRKTLRQNGLDAEVFETRQRGDAEIAARKYGKGYDLIIAAGGDGTVNETASGIYGTGGVLGIIPLGTGNVLARELHMPLDVERACRAVAIGSPREMDVGIARWGKEEKEQLFLCMAGAGFDAAVAHACAQIRLGSGRFFRYVLPTLRSLRDFDLPRIRITVDGRPIEKPASSVVVGNIREYGGPFTVTPFAGMDDGLLHVCAIFARTRRDLMHCMCGAVGGRHVRYPDVLYLTAQRVHLEADSEVRLQFDGDAIGFLPSTFTIAHRAFSVIAPPEQPGRAAFLRLFAHWLAAAKKQLDNIGGEP